MNFALALFLCLANNRSVTLDVQDANSAAALSGSSTVQRHELVCGGGICNLPNTPGIYRIVHIPSAREYIGSSFTLYRRVYAHLYRLRGNKHPLKFMQNVFNKYGEAEFGFQVLELVETESSEILTAREQWYLDGRKPQFNARKIAVNSNKGVVMSESARKKIGDFWRGKKYSRERIEKSAAARRGKPINIRDRESWLKNVTEFNMKRAQTPEHRARISLLFKGKKQSPEFIEKRAAALRGRKLSSEHAAKSRAASLGRVQSPEERLMRSVAQRGRVFPPEHRAKISAALKGRKLSQESRDKISKALTGRRPSLETIEKYRAKMVLRPRDALGRLVKQT